MKMQNVDYTVSDCAEVLLKISWKVALFDSSRCADICLAASCQSLRRHARIMSRCS